MDQLTAIVGDASGATGVVLHLRDDAGHGMDTAKVIQGPGGKGYVAVYHWRRHGVFVTSLATSRDLRYWHYEADLAVHASQPSLSSLSDGGYLLAVEADERSGKGIPMRLLRFFHYATYRTLLDGSAARQFTADHVIVGRHGGAEGTPSIESAELRPDIAHSTIRVGFHYLTDGLDHEARGTLTNFSHWSGAPDVAFDTALTKAGLMGKHGDRDTISFRGRMFDLVEGQRRLDGPWGLYLFDRHTMAVRPVPFRTAAGASSAANPTITAVTLSCGEPALVMTAFLPRLGAAQRLMGEVLYYVAIGQTTPRHAGRCLPDSG